MGRNKYPEQTVEKIIITAARLFSEKGYEQTSIQDILDALKLSKGGLYITSSQKKRFWRLSYRRGHSMFLTVSMSSFVILRLKMQKRS